MKKQADKQKKNGKAARFFFLLREVCRFVFSFSFFFFSSAISAVDRLDPLAVDEAPAWII